MSTFLKKKIISKKSYADRPYLIFFGDVSGNKEHFLRLTVIARRTSLGRRMSIMTLAMF